jgi:iron complex outermembrane recepter protein
MRSSVLIGIRASVTRSALSAVALFAYSNIASAQAAAPTTNESDPSHRLEEIVVTAQRRSENIQRVPVSVSAFNADALQSLGVAVTTKDLPSLVPGLVFGKGLSNNLSYMRGVGQPTGRFGVESPLATYLDGVYLAAPAATLFSLNNVERIEVLKGPQGTLFGRNSTAGVIHVITKDPTTQPSAEFDAGYGRYDTATGRFYGNTAIGNSLGANLALYYSDRGEGHIHNVTTGKDIGQDRERAAQSKWRWTPSERTVVTFNLAYSDHAGYLGTTTGMYPGALAGDRSTRYLGQYTVADPADTLIEDDQYLGSIRFEQDLGWAKLINIAAYHGLSQRMRFSQTANPPVTPPVSSLNGSIFARTKNADHTFTEELQLQSSTDSDFQWITGVFYMDDKVDINQTVLNYTTLAPVVLNNTDVDQTTTSYAAFAQASKTILSDTRLTLGIRYTRDELEVKGARFNGGALNGFNYTPGTFIGTAESMAATASRPFKPSVTASEPAYRVSLDHSFTPSIMGYVSFNQGFKSGIFNSSDFTNPPTEPERLKAYELGVKSELFDRMRLNAAAFYYDYKNMQLLGIGPAPPALYNYNAGSARITGLDIDFEVAATDELRLTGGFEWLPEAEYTSLKGGLQTLPNPYPYGFQNGAPVVPAGCALGSPLPQYSALSGGNSTLSCDLSGNRLIRSPRMSATLGIQYRWSLPSGASVMLNANDSYSSKFYFADDNRTKQDAFHNVRASITWTSHSDVWSVQAWGSNLVNEKISAGTIEATNDVYFVGEPRLYGLSVGWRL